MCRPRCSRGAGGECGAHTARSVPPPPPGASVLSTGPGAPSPLCSACSRHPQARGPRSTEPLLQHVATSARWAAAPRRPRQEAGPRPAQHVAPSAQTPCCSNPLTVVSRRRAVLNPDHQILVTATRAGARRTSSALRGPMSPSRSGLTLTEDHREQPFVGSRCGSQDPGASSCFPPRPLRGGTALGAAATQGMGWRTCVGSPARFRVTGPRPQRGHLLNTSKGHQSELTVTRTR